jgi:hypothetical protein
MSTTPDELRARAADFLEFVRHDVLDCADGQLRSFASVADDWQWSDLRAIAPALHMLMGRSAEVKPTMKHFWERPRGHDKTGSAARVMRWPLLFSSKPLTMIAAAGDADQADLLRREIARQDRFDRLFGGSLTINNDRIINEQTGSRLDILMADAPSSYGLTPDFVFADELSNWRQEELWTSIVSASAKRRSVMLVSSNAGCGMGSPKSWQWRVREAIRTDPAWRFSSLPGCVASWISADTLDEQRRLLPVSAFQRLWQNRWVAEAGDALEGADIDAAVNRELANHVVIPGWHFIAALDLGLKSDATALVIVGVNIELQRVYVAGISAWRPMPGRTVSIEAIEKEFLYRDDYYGGFILTVVDPWQAAQLCERLRAKGLNVHEYGYSAANMHDQATALLSLFREQRIELYPDADLIADLRLCAISERTGNRLKLELARDERGHSDRLAALALAAPFAIEALAHFEPPVSRGNSQSICLTDEYDCNAGY